MIISIRHGFILILSSYKITRLGVVFKWNSEKWSNFCVSDANIKFLFHSLFLEAILDLKTKFDIILFINLGITNMLSFEILTLKSF